MNSSAKACDDAREIAEPKPAAGCLPQGDGLDAGELALERELEQVIDWLEVLAIFRMERLLRDGDRPRAEDDDAPPPTPLPPDQPTVSPQSTTPWAQLLAELAGDPLARLSPPASRFRPLIIRPMVQPAPALRSTAIKARESERAQRRQRSNPQVRDGQSCGPLPDL
ncbi:MAG: hypothetical protein ACK5Q7_14295, partial [Cyanobacteriota bacterium]